MADLCSMCDETNVDAGAGDICADCIAWLDGLDNELAEMEANDAHLLDLGRKVDAAASALLHPTSDAESGEQSDEPTGGE